MKYGDLNKAHCNKPIKIFCTIKQCLPYPATLPIRFHIKIEMNCNNTAKKLHKMYQDIFYFVLYKTKYANSVLNRTFPKLSTSEYSEWYQFIIRSRNTVHRNWLGTAVVAIEANWQFCVECSMSWVERAAKKRTFEVSKIRCYKIGMVTRKRFFSTHNREFILLEYLLSKIGSGS